MTEENGKKKRESETYSASAIYRIKLDEAIVQAKPAGEEPQTPQPERKRTSERKEQ